MAVRPENRGAELTEGGLDALAQAGLALGTARTLSDAMQILAEAAGRATGAEIVIVRVADEARRALVTCAVVTSSAAVAAELEGSRLPIEDMPALEESEAERLPDGARQAAERVHAGAAVLIPVHVDGRVQGSVELMRAETPFNESELRLARLAAGQAGLVIRAFAGAVGEADSEAVLGVAGEALAAGGDELRTAEQVTRLATNATRALAGLLWRRGPEDELELVVSVGAAVTQEPLVDARSAADRALVGRHAVSVESVAGLPGLVTLSATLQLGQPPLGALQLLFAEDTESSDVDLATLATFGVRAAHALRASMHARSVELELGRTRALLGVVGQAISQLSLAHTLETAVARVGELLEADRLAVYLREEGRLYAAAGLGLAGPHLRLADRLLELTLGPFRSRGMLVVDDVYADPRLTGVADAAAEAGIEAAIAVPLLARDEVIGLLGVFPSSGRVLTENESALLAALAAQLAVAVQNAQLHERAKQLGGERERALDAERAASKQVRALYEISRSFAQSLSLEATLEAVADTIVEILGVDVALIRMPDERREYLLPRAMKVSEPRVGEAAHSILYRPQRFAASPIQRLFRLREAFAVTVESVTEIGPPATALIPFLERGWTAAVLPIATPAEVLASLTILSMQPGSPVTQDTIDQATAIAGQAALAIDNARLYQQQKQFSDMMQRSLLPRSVPELQGLELGDAYESSAHVEVGGDVYDFMELGDGRLAVALGDVTGHGIEAAADMAMAKFTFRSLAREHPEPADFLQSANEVIVGEIAPGKFITLVYLLIDGTKGEVSAAGAGHPPPRIIGADGTVTGLEARGLVLGIEPNQKYEEVHASLEHGSTVVLYTDGVIEARRDGELYGAERLDRVLTERRDLPAGELAQAVLDDCRAFARGQLADDCAVVVVKRT
ncbi:MAG: SpoIIE family protein phosphatase [Actinobacteria bacterium]|nr:SpoIIE family protein phosphatase [Actinomycetota bacterium]